MEIGLIVLTILCAVIFVALTWIDKHTRDWFGGGK